MEDNLLAIGDEFVEVFRDFMRHGIKFREIHQEDLVVMHPGVEVSVFDISLLNNDVSLVGGG